MDPLNWKRLAILAAGGIAVGFGAATAIEATGWNPLAAPLMSIAAAAAVAVALRRLELLNFFVDDGVFAYCTFIGMAIVRTSGHNYLAVKFDYLPGTSLLTGLNLVVAAVGIPYAFAAVLIGALPVWALAQRARHRRTPDEEKFWEFVEEQNRSR